MQYVIKHEFEQQGNLISNALILHNILMSLNYMKITTGYSLANFILEKNIFLDQICVN